MSIYQPNIRDTDFLYKYRKCNEYSFSILIDKRLYLATPKELNDPFDSQIDIPEALKITLNPTDLNVPDEFRELFEKIKNDANKISMHNDDFINLFERTKILSFSLKKDDPLMWSHYTDSCKGFNLGFDPNHFRNNTILLPVTYCSFAKDDDSALKIT